MWFVANPGWEVTEYVVNLATRDFTISVVRGNYEWRPPGASWSTYPVCLRRSTYQEGGTLSNLCRPCTKRRQRPFAGRDELITEVILFRP